MGCDTGNWIEIAQDGGLYSTRCDRKKTDGFQRHIFLYIIKFSVLCFSVYNLYTMPFAAKILLLSNSVAMTTQINKYRRQCSITSSARYIEMLDNFVQPQLNELAADVEDIWFQRDGATAHTAQRKIRYLRELFPRHIISDRGDIPWLARSPDLAPCDFLHWGYLREEIYQLLPRNLLELRTAIREDIQHITLAMFLRVMRNFRRRRNSCIVWRMLYSTSKVHELVNLRVSLNV